MKTLDTRRDTSELTSLANVIQPWSNSQPDEAPEEQSSPLPAQFEYASNFLGKTREEAIQEFKDMFDEHIAPEMKEKTKIIDLLMNKGLKVFVPEEWSGIKGIDPLKIDFKDTLPDRLKPAARPVNPRIYQAAEKEFKRMKTYFYKPSRSPWASPLVIAPKATKPFIRFCGDYVTINKYIPTGHFFIPHIRHELDRIIGYTVYLDIDLTNAFHQIPLHPDTSAKLSVQTPWGQFEPEYMPEGIGPGSGTLQEVVHTLFEEFDWAIVIFDNVLILAHNYDDAYQKLETFLDKCIRYNVILKFAKSWLGFQEVTFFGYKCNHNSLQLTDDRKKAILEIPFPENGNRCKKVRSLLGCGVMFAAFVPMYSNLVADLTDMTKPSFDWDEKTWKKNYRKQFEDFKQGLQKACAVFYPNYELEWTLRTDASDYGVGAVLIQFATDEHGEKIAQPIAFFSKKFSVQAMVWPTIEKEGYAIYSAVKKFSYYLVGKHFTIETDHNNLRWMEASEVPKIVRWRIYLQSYSFDIQHIKGTANTVADALSRLLLLLQYEFEEHNDPSQDDHFLLNIMGHVFGEDVDQTLSTIFSEAAEQTNESKETKFVKVKDVFKEVHNAKVGHWGLKETWKRLNKEFPGHGIPMMDVSEMVATCPTCQKTRKERRDKLIPMKRHLKPPHSRSAIGTDALSVTPHGSNGETHIIVIVNLFSKFVYLTPVKGNTALNLAVTIWKYWCNFGFTDMIVSDRGPDLTSTLFAELTKLVDVRHVFSIADRHVNGSERLIKEVSRHLRAIVYDERLPNIFDDVTIIPSVQHIMNEHKSVETGHTPNELTFGSHDAIYHELLKTKDESPTHVLLQRLNENLKVLRKSSSEYQQRLIKERIDQKPLVDNAFQPGDFVMFDAGPKPSPKMSCRYKGPYKVDSQYRNDVLCRNLITDALVTFSLEDLEPFFCSSEKEAYEAALRDNNQYTVKAVLSYSGDSRARTRMTFEVEFQDGDIIQLPWSHDLECEAYYEFCESKPYLRHLTMDTKLAKVFQKQMRKEPITAVQPGDTVFIDLRFFGDDWYEALDLPDAQHSSYVCEFQYTHWYHKTSKSKLSGRFPVLNESYSLDGYFIYCWGSSKTLDTSSMQLVDEDFVARYPSILRN